MIVAQPLRGRDPVVLNPRSRTLYNPITATNVEHMRAEVANPRLVASPLRGYGMRGFEMPEWGWYALGGAALGTALAVGFAMYRR